MIKELLQSNNVKQAYEEFIKLHPHDQANLYLTLTDSEKLLLNEELKDYELSEMLIYVDSEEAALILEEFTLKRQKSLIEKMPIDDAVDVIEELSEDSYDDLLEVVDNPIDYHTLLQYKPNEAGSLMTSRFLILNLGMDVKDAMRTLINNAPNVESLNTLFVTNDKKYVGTLPLNKLIKAKSPLLIDELLEESPKINVLEEVDVTVHKMREYSVYQIAVVNDQDNLIGVITLDDAIEAYERVTSEDFRQFSALSETEHKSIIKSARIRLPWLLILLFSSIPLALIGTGFEDVLLSFAILALFQPLILDASGDVATQTLAVTLRKLNQTDGASFKDGMDEVVTGSINAVILGIASALITLLIAYVMKIDNPFGTSLVVGLSLLITVIIGPIFGFVVPVVLNKMKLDPAVASGPFITTLVDLFSLLVFFGLASLILM